MKSATSIGLVVLLGALGCSSPPPFLFPSSARTLWLEEKQFKIAVLSFGDGPLAQALPAMLLTELRKEGRYVLHEGGAIRTSADKLREPAINEKNAWNVVDAYLSGTVTSESSTEVCFDVRLENARNHIVMFAGSTCTRYQSAGSSMVPQRAAVERLAHEISLAVKKIEHARVISVETVAEHADGESRKHPYVYLNKGRAAGVMNGMVGYIVETAETVADQDVHRAVYEYTRVNPGVGTSDKVSIVGGIYIVAVEDSYSVGRLDPGSYALPGDTVFFK